MQPYTTDIKILYIYISLNQIMSLTMCVGLYSKRLDNYLVTEVNNIHWTRLIINSYFNEKKRGYKCFNNLIDKASYNYY